MSSTFTLVVSEECVQCPTWLIFVVIIIIVVVVVVIIIGDGVVVVVVVVVAAVAEVVLCHQSEKITVVFIVCGV
jgi:hypothetical protein